MAALLAVVLALVAAGSGMAAAPAPQVPATVVQPLGDGTAAVVSYRELVGAADARRLNAAVVDTSAYWVAAVDRNGHIIAARIPRPTAGKDFGTAVVPTTGTPAGPRRPFPGPSTSRRRCATTAWRCSLRLPPRRPPGRAASCACWPCRSASP